MSIQIAEKSVDGLSRVYAVSISAAELAERQDKRIKEIAPQMQLKGFRPGKVPVAHVRRVHGKSILGEVVETQIGRASCRERV